MKAAEFAKTNATDADWVRAMGDKEITPLAPGQQVTHSGFPFTVQRHYHNGMYEIRGASGGACVASCDLLPA